MKSNSKKYSLSQALRYVKSQMLFTYWLIAGPKFKAEAHKVQKKYAVAILVENSHSYQLRLLVDRFAKSKNVTFVTWGPRKISKRFINSGNWLHSRANSWGSAANFALNNLGAKTVLIVGQEFDLKTSHIKQLKFEGDTSIGPVVFGSNGLVISCGLGRDAKTGLLKHSLRDFSEADVPRTKLPSTRLGVRALLVANGGFSCFARDASGYIGESCVDGNFRIGLLKDYPEPPKYLINGLFKPTGRLLIPKTDAPRWSIKNPAYAGAWGDTWGDTFFASDLAKALRSLGALAAEDRRENWYRKTARFDDVDLVIRGPHRYYPNAKRISILWVISSPHLVTVEEIDSYDLVFAASETWARKMEILSGKKIEVLLQATEPARFNPEAYDDGFSSKVLFVGSTAGKTRTSVDYAHRAGVELHVYGSGHDPVKYGSLVRADFLSNQLVPSAYASTDLVLNDHVDVMREEGFISNRVFDAAACGSRVLSDKIDGIEGKFLGLVKTYENFEDFNRLVHDLGAWPTTVKRLSAAAEIAKMHSFTARAETLAKSVREIQSSRASKAR